MNTVLEQLRKHRASSGGLRRGQTPTLANPHGAGGFANAIGRGILGAILGFLAWGVHKQSFSHASIGANWGALIGFFGYCTWPFLLSMWTVLRVGRWPTAEFYQRFPGGQKILCVCVLALGCVFIGNHAVAAFTYWEHHQPPLEIHAMSITSNRAHLRHEGAQPYWRTTFASKNAYLPLKTRLQWSIAWLVVSGLLFLFFYRLQHRSLQPQKKPSAGALELPFGLYIGRSTGQLSQLAHGTGLAPNQNVVLSLEDAAQNLLVLGAIGSGKTTRAIHPFLIQLLDQGCGGLIFDIKGDFQTAVSVFAAHAQRHITTIGPGFEKMNLLAGLSPEMAASFLKSAFLLNGKALNDTFWMDTATELCRNTLGVLSFLPAYYSLQGLYRYLFDVEDRLAIWRDCYQRWMTRHDGY